MSCEANNTLSVSTRSTNLFSENSLSLGTIVQGVAAILATTRFAVCSAMVVDAKAYAPLAGIALHMMRINPISGTEE